MFNIGGGEMVMLAIIALLVFGPQGLPEIAGKVARTVKALRRTAAEFQNEIQTALQEENRERDKAQRRRYVGQEKAETESDPPPPPRSEGEPSAEANLVSQKAVPEEQIAECPETNAEGSHAALEQAAEGSPSEPEDDDGPAVPMTTRRTSVQEETEPDGPALEEALPVEANEVERAPA